MTSEFNEYQPQATIPENFPRNVEYGAVSGANIKCLARCIAGKYVVGDTPAEHQERYLACCSLVSDLIAYCRKKQMQDATWTAQALHQRVTEGLKDSPQLELTRQELDWVLRELSIHMHWQISGGGPR